MVTLQKHNPNTRLGIVFHKKSQGDGNSESKDPHVVRPIINLLSSDGIAAQSEQLQPGDEIVCVNGFVVSSNYAACQKLREADSKLELVVKLAKFQALSS